MRIALLRAASTEPLGGEALADVLAGAAPLGRIRADPARFDALLGAAAAELAASAPPSIDEATPSPAHRLAWALEDHLATLRSALRDATSGIGEADAAARLLRIATTCRALAAEPDFGFLFHRKRRLFHIGFRVAEHQLDGGFYDLLASEARATSLLGDRQGRRAGRALGRARPAVLRRRRARRACARGRARCSST